MDQPHCDGLWNVREQSEMLVLSSLTRMYRWIVLLDVLMNRRVLWTREPKYMAVVLYAMLR